jgi:NhaP-type Na+/H+ or K+/H+ antiporter/CRP-like cAMP-binding protein
VHFTAISGEEIYLDLETRQVQNWPNASYAAHHAEHEGDHTGGLMFLMCVCLVVGWIWRKLEHFVGNCDLCGHSIPSVVPFTVLLLFSGMAIGALNTVIERSDFGGLGYSIDYWREKDPHYLMYLFLPPLIFSSAHHVDFHVLRRSLGHILYLAGPGVVISTALTATFVKYVFFTYGWSWEVALTFGSMMSATDPVAVVALLADLGAPKTLSILIEGESHFNDGTAYVFFILFKQLVGGAELTLWGVVVLFVQLAAGGCAIGVAMGIVMNYCMKHSSDARTEITLTLLFAYSAFIVAEACGTSGVLSVVILGFTMAQGGAAYVTHKEALETFWEEAELLANTMIFCISGLIIMDNFQLSGLFDPGVVSAEDDFTPIDWFYLAVLYVALQVIRFTATFSLYFLDIIVFRNCRCCRCVSCSRAGGLFGPKGLTCGGIAKHMGEGLLLSKKRLINEYDTSWRTATVASWGGLRGAIGLCLALMVSRQFTSSEHGMSDVPLGPKFLFHMSGVALLTLVVNGSTAGRLVQWLGLVSASAASKVSWENATQHMNHTMKHVIEKLKHSEMYTCADWEVVLKFLPTFSEQAGAEIEQTVDQMFLREPETATKIKRSIKGLNMPYLRKVKSRFDPTPWLCCKSLLSKTKLFARVSAKIAASGQNEKLIAERVASTLVRVHDSIDKDGAVGSEIIGATEKAEEQQRRLQREMWPFLVDARYRYLNRVKSEYYSEAELGKVTERACKMLLEATAIAQDNVRMHDSVPDAGRDREKAGLAEWPIVEKLTLNESVHKVMDVAKNVLFLKEAVHMHTAMYWDLVVDVSTTFIEVHVEVLHEYKEALATVLAGDHGDDMAVLRDRAVTEAIIREAELDLAAAHEIFKIVPHTSSMGRHSLTRICVRHIHKMCEREAIELKENGELEDAEFDLMMWAISRCSTKHALRIPWLVHAPTKHFMMSTNLKEAHAAEPELFRRLEKLSTQEDIPAGQTIFKQLQTESTVDKWGVYIILEGSVALERGRVEQLGGKKAKVANIGAAWKGRVSIHGPGAAGREQSFRRPRRMSTLGMQSSARLAAAARGAAEPSGDSDSAAHDNDDGTSSSVWESGDDEHAASDGEPEFGAFDVHVGEASGESDPTTEDDDENCDDVVDASWMGFASMRGGDTAAAAASNECKVSPTRRKKMGRQMTSSRLLRTPTSSRVSTVGEMTPLQRTNVMMWRRGGLKKNATTRLVVRDAYQIDVVKGKGHVVGVLSVLTGKPRYVSAAAFGPVVGCYISAARLFEIFEDAHEVDALVKKQAAISASLLKVRALESILHPTTSSVLVRFRFSPFSCNADSLSLSLSLQAHPSLANSPTAYSRTHSSGFAASVRDHTRDATGTKGISIDAWFDYSCEEPSVKARLMNDTNWSKHRTSTLESAFTLEAAVSAAQIYLRYTDESTAKQRAALPQYVHPAQAQSLIAALDVVLQGSAMLGDDMSLAAFFRAHNVDPVSVDIARPILEKATLLMPCMATLPNTMTLTHPVYVVQGDITVLPPGNRAPRTGGAASGTSQKLVAPVLIIASPEHHVTISVDAVASAGSKGASAPRIVVLPESHTIAAECTVSRVLTPASRTRVRTRVRINSHCAFPSSWLSLAFFSGPPLVPSVPLPSRS